MASAATVSVTKPPPSLPSLPAQSPDIHSGTAQPRTTPSDVASSSPYFRSRVGQFSIISSGQPQSDARPRTAQPRIISSGVAPSPPVVHSGESRRLSAANLRPGSSSSAALCMPTSTSPPPESKVASARQKPESAPIRAKPAAAPIRAKPASAPILAKPESIGEEPQAAAIREEPQAAPACASRRPRNDVVEDDDDHDDDDHDDDVKKKPTEAEASTLLDNAVYEDLESESWNRSSFCPKDFHPKVSIETIANENLANYLRRTNDFFQNYRNHNGLVVDPRGLFADLPDDPTKAFSLRMMADASLYPRW